MNSELDRGNHSPNGHKVIAGPGVRKRINATTKLAVGLVSFFLTACATTQKLKPSADTLREIGQSAVDDDGIVGLSIAVSLGGNTIFAEGFGYADLERTTPASPTTSYDLGSIGKQFTATATMLLVDEGRLSLSDRLYDLVPETPRHFPNATVHQLLQHTSGFVAGPFDDLDPPPGLDQPRRGLEVLNSTDLQGGRSVFPAGETFIYCNPAYTMLGTVIEAASGRPFTEFITSELIEPLNLTMTTVGQRPSPPQMADSLCRSEDGIARVPFIHMSVYGGAGSICSSVSDLLAWELALDEGRVLSPNSLQQLKSPARVQGSFATAEIPYGMGQRLGTFLGYRKSGHTGTYAGGSASLAHYPEAGLTIAVASNTYGNGTPHARLIEAEVARALLSPVGSDEPVAGVPLTEEEQSQIAGYYGTGSVIEARFENSDTLLLLREGKESDRMVHVGEFVFRKPKNPNSREWFLLDGEAAGWWLYEVDGFLMGVDRRVEP